MPAAPLQQPTLAPTPPTEARPTSAPVAAGTATSATQPRVGGTLRAGSVGDPPSLEGHLFVSNNYETTGLVFDRLTQYDSKLQPQPMLAESWEISPDYQLIKLNLRKGVQWHSGRDFTSDDVKYNIVRAQDPKDGAGQFANQAKWFTNIDTTDKYTAILTTDQPRPLVFDFFEYFNMVDRETVEGPNAKTTTVGTGPFKFIEWVPGDHLAFAKNQNYWQTGRPYLDGVQARVARDPQAMVALFEGGSLDTMRSAPLADYARLKDDPAYQAVVHPNPGSYYCVAFNTLNAPFDNKTVRQALNYAIDRKRFVDTALYGVSQAQDLPWLPGSPAYEANKQDVYPFDTEKARTLLEQAGVSQIEMDILFTASAEANVLTQIYQADLAKLGIKMNIKVLDTAAWLDQVNNRKYNGAYWSGASYGQLSPGTTFSGSKAWDPSNNNSGFKNDTYLRLVAAATSETEPAKQKQIYSQLNDLLLDESFVAIVAPSPSIVMARAGVHNLSPNYHAAFTYTEAWLEP
jgi:peptide/nickel transport system substrate-binding protein